MDRPAKIISGGQTGADFGALRAAYTLGIPTGGFVPKDYWTERGAFQALRRYGVTEMPTRSYRARTIRNLQAADGTVIFGNIENAGSRVTVALLKKAAKPLLINPSPTLLRAWVAAKQIAVLNVAGNRESGNRGIEDYVFAVLLTAWGTPEQQAFVEGTFVPVLNPPMVAEET